MKNPMFKPLLVQANKSITNKKIEGAEVVHSAQKAMAYGVNTFIQPLTQGLKVTGLCLALGVLASCGKTSKPVEHTPTKLVKLAQNPAIIAPVFAASLPGKSKLAQFGRLDVGYNSDQVIAAASAGQVIGFNHSGQRLWSVEVGDNITGGIGFDSTSQTAFVTTASAQVVAIDTQNGAINWQKSLNGTVLAPALIHKDRVILLANDGTVHGLSLQTGESIWQFTTQAPSISLRGSAKPTLLDDNTVLIASADGRLHAMDVESGIPLWSRRVGSPSGASEIQRMTDVDGTPTIDNGQLFAVSYSGQLVGVDLRSRQILFVKEAASKNSLAVSGDAVIITTLDGMVNAYNRQTGAVLWESDALAYRKLSNPVAIGNYVAVGDLDGIVHLLSPQNGEIVSRVNAKGPINLLKSQDGYLLTQTESGQVHMWQLTN